MDESELYIYKDGEFIFKGEECSSALSYDVFLEGISLLKYSENDAAFETKRGIKIGSSIEEVIEAYSGYFCFVSDSSAKHLKSNAMKYHEINSYYEYSKDKNLIPLYELADYSVEYDVFSTKNGLLDYFELIKILKEQEISYLDFLGKETSEGPISRKYIRFLIKDDQVVDIWIWFEKEE